MATNHRGNPINNNNAAKTNAERAGFSTTRPTTGEYGSGSAKTIGGQSIPRTDVYASGNQPGGRDGAGGGSVYAYSAKTRNSAPVTGDEYRSSIKSGQSPDTARGSKAAYKVANDSMKPYGTTMNTVKSNYRKFRKSGLSPDASRTQALNSDGVVRQKTLSQDYSGENVL